MTDPPAQLASSALQTSAHLMALCPNKWSGLLSHNGWLSGRPTRRHAALAIETHPDPDAVAVRVETSKQVRHGHTGWVTIVAPCGEDLITGAHLLAHERSAAGRPSSRAARRTSGARSYGAACRPGGARQEHQARRVRSRSVSKAVRSSIDRVAERRRAVALARHYRESEGLSIRQIADRLGRSPATVKAYF
jgi:Homeodomain-like domain